MTDEPKVVKATAMLFNRRGEAVLAFCRGSAKGCTKNHILQSKIGPCADCVEATDGNEKLGDFIDRMEKGNA